MLGKEDKRVKISCIKVPSKGGKNNFYVSNQEPLAASTLIKLPIGTIKPGGWLLTWLQLERDGMIGHLDEISPWLAIQDNAWCNPNGKGKSNWEELPYWLKGYGDLGYVLNDKEIIKRTKFWLEVVLKYQQSDGYFGPAERKKINDYWSHMLMLNCLQSYYEFSEDKRVIPFILKFFRYLDSLPEDKLLPKKLYWPYIRGGDLFQSIIWTYNRTGKKWLLAFAQKTHQQTTNWSGGLQNWHVVNLAQGFREPAQYYQLAKDDRYLEATESNWNRLRWLYGQFPGGMYAADENARPGYTDPRQAAETCAMVEFMLSAEFLIAIDGRVTWADRAEDVYFNTLPAAITPDFKGLHYLTAPNMVQLDHKNKSPGIQNSGCMLAYSPHRYRCCQHNVSHGWPYLSEHLWYATPDNGLACVFYCASQVKAKVGNGVEIIIEEKTDYPFDEKVNFVLSIPKEIAFPLMLRIPGWCENASLTINNKEIKNKLESGSFAIIEKKWQNGDQIELTLPMELKLVTWKEKKNSVSINRGPLTYSLKIKESWKKYTKEKAAEKWPEWDVYPKSPWNYALEINSKNPLAGFEIKKKHLPKKEQIFTQRNCPIEIKTKGRKIPEWKMALGLVGVLQSSPVKTKQPLENITLIPMGCARLRISSFPVVGHGKNSHQWTESNSKQR